MYSTVAALDVNNLENRISSPEGLHVGQHVRIFWTSLRPSRFQYGTVLEVGSKAVGDRRNSFTCDFKVNYPPQLLDPEGGIYSHSLDKMHVEPVEEEEWAAVFPGLDHDRCNVGTTTTSHVADHRAQKGQNPGWENPILSGSQIHVAVDQCRHRQWCQKRTPRLSLGWLPKLYPSRERGDQCLARR